MFTLKYAQCYDRSYYIPDFFCVILSFRVIVDFVFYSSALHSWESVNITYFRERGFGIVVILSIEPRPFVRRGLLLKKMFASLGRVAMHG